MSGKPNFLIILSDEHRHDCIGIMGNDEIKTPNLDKIGQDGVVYKKCFCTLPVCTPSRYSFLTGLYVHQHMGWSNHSTVPPALPKFPKLLQESGYRTKAVGKMHFTPTYEDMGFQEMSLAEQVGPGRYDDDFHRNLKEKGLIDETDLVDQVSEYRKNAKNEYWDNFGTDTTNLPEEEYCTSWIGDKAVESLEKWKQTDNNLLMVGFIKPHHPFDVPEPWATMYDPDDVSLLPGWLDELPKIDEESNKGHIPHVNLNEKKMKKITAKYYGSISMIDHQIGRMVEKLKKMGLYDNTIIIYISDHGDYMGYHHMCFKSNYMYDAITNVPLIIKYPNSEYAGMVSENLVSTIDVTGLILDSADLMVPKLLWNTVRVLDPEEGRKYVFSEYSSPMGSTGYMIRSKTRKLLYYDKKPSQFFNLEEDPLETNNLIGNSQYESEIFEMKEELFKWLAFQSLTPEYLDENYPLIKGDNVPDLNDEHRNNMKLYFKKKMKDLGYN